MPRLHCGKPAAGRAQARDAHLRRRTPSELLGQGAPGVAEDGPCHGLEEDAVLVGDLIRRADEDAAGPIDHMRIGARRDQPQDLILELLAVTGAILVPDHQIHGQSLQAPIGMRLHQLMHQLDVRRVADLHQHHRHVAGHRMAPEPGLSAPILQRARSARRAARHWRRGSSWPGVRRAARRTGWH